MIPVSSEIGASDGDLEEQFVLARYRVWIDAAQYKKLVAYIKQRKAHLGPWHAFLNNCVTFGRDVAVFLNLNVPPLMRFAPSVVMYPKDVVEWIRDANNGEKDQGPLKDAAGALPVEVAAKVHAKPTQAADASTERQHRREACSQQEAACQQARREQGIVCDRTPQRTIASERNRFGSTRSRFKILWGMIFSKDRLPLFRIILEGSQTSSR